MKKKYEGKHFKVHAELSYPGGPCKEEMIKQLKNIGRVPQPLWRVESFKFNIVVRGREQSLCCFGRNFHLQHYIHKPKKKKDLF